jgi:hypothetical protein
MEHCSVPCVQQGSRDCQTPSSIASSGLQAHVHVVAGEEQRAELHYRVYTSDCASKYRLAPCSHVARSRSPFLEEILQLAAIGHSMELPVEHHAFLAWHTFVATLVLQEHSSVLQEHSPYFASLCNIVQV